jgi:hypothetical protein
VLAQATEVIRMSMWRGWRHDGPTLAGWGLAAVVFSLVDWRAHDGWALHPVTQAAAIKPHWMILHTGL